MKTKRILALLVLLCLLLSGCVSVRINPVQGAASTAAPSEDAPAAVQPKSFIFPPVPSAKKAVEAPPQDMLMGVSAAAEISSTVSQDMKFGSAVVPLSREEFEAAGFQLGDSCDLFFGSGYELTDVPFFNGYYVKNGEPVVVAYPGSSTVSITLNNMGIWSAAGLSEGDSVLIRMNTPGKFSAIQDTLGQVYSFLRKEYESDEQFCNFRALSGGRLKQDYLFRGASPVDNSRKRAPYTDGLLEKQGIRFIVDLADSEANMSAYTSSPEFASPYTASVHADGRMVLLDMSSSYASEAYQKKVVEGLRAMLASEGPVYIHCMEGKDRTGFVCMLLEALAGASYDEMLADYMITYRNYYSVSLDKTPEKYDAIAALYFDSFVEYLHGSEDKEELKSADYTADAAAYLAAGGMTEEETALLTAYITE